MLAASNLKAKFPSISVILHDIPRSKNEFHYSSGRHSFRASTSQVRGSNPDLDKVDLAFRLFSGSINEYQDCLGTKHWWFSSQTDHLTMHLSAQGYEN
ncbi:hypothetical protein TNCV_2655551 [Trichonephila clavipes]|nr:hypothetical protein TNCV_2655551 [Trichonephila clavipes]